MGVPIHMESYVVEVCVCGAVARHCGAGGG